MWCDKNDILPLSSFFQNPWPQANNEKSNRQIPIEGHSPKYASNPLTHQNHQKQGKSEKLRAKTTLENDGIVPVWVWWFWMNHHLNDDLGSNPKPAVSRPKKSQSPSSKQSGRWSSLFLTFFVLLRSSIDWLMPNHIRVGNLLYSVHQFKC